MKLYSFTHEGLTEYVNDALHVYLTAMRTENIITDEVYNNLQRYKVVVNKPTFWGTFWNKIFTKLDEKVAHFMVVKVILPTSTTGFIPTENS